MIEWQWPWLLLLLPLPWLVRHLLRPAQAQVAALRVPDLAPFSPAEAGRGGAAGLRRGPLLLAALAWCLLVVAAVRPVWFGEPVELPVSGRDLMLAVDLSESMGMEDFVLEGERVNRLAATKRVAGEFIERRVGDRMGLILFGTRAYVQTPLTFDRTTVRRLLEEAYLGMAEKATAIGDAIGLAVKRLGESDGSRVLVLLTDGANTAGEVAPLQAAELAARKGLTIYTIGVGADEMLVRSLFGVQRVDPSRDLDEETLRGIAEATGGRYFRARDSAELERIYRLLDEIEPVDREHETFRPQRALFHWPLAAALLLAAGVIGWRLKGET